MEEPKEQKGSIPVISNWFPISSELGNYIEFQLTLQDQKQSSPAHRLVFVLDYSQSMGQAVQSMQEAVRQIYNRMNETQRSSTLVLSYSTQCTAMSIKKYVETSWRAGGCTNFISVLEEMGNLLEQDPTQDVRFFFMTDGQFFTDTLYQMMGLTPVQASNHLLTKQKKMFQMIVNSTSPRKVIIDAIGYGIQVDQTFITDLQAIGTSMGTFRFVSAGTQRVIQTNRSAPFGFHTVTSNVVHPQFNDTIENTNQLMKALNEVFDYDQDTLEAEIMLECLKPITLFLKDKVSSQYTGSLVLSPSQGVDNLEAAMHHLKTNGFYIQVPIKHSDQCTHYPFQLAQNPLPTLCRPQQQLKALDYCDVSTSKNVTLVLKELGKLTTKGCKGPLERLQLEVSRKEFNTRLLTMLELMNAQQLGKVTSESELKLKSLKYEATFSKARRNRAVAIRTDANMDEFKQLDGELHRLQDSISRTDLEELQSLSDAWSCMHDLTTLREAMTDTIDDFLCLGIRVERDEVVVDSPSTGLKLLSVSSSLISYHTFVENMKRAIEQRGDAQAHGGFTLKRKIDSHDLNLKPDYESKSYVPSPSQSSSSVAASGPKLYSSDISSTSTSTDVYCMVGQRQEKINAVIPLFLHPQHGKRIQVMKKCWLGYLFMLDPLAYDKQQDVAFVNLIVTLMKRLEPLDYHKTLIRELVQVAHGLTDSTEYKAALPDARCDGFVKDLHQRERQYVNNLQLMLSHAFLQDLRAQDRTFPRLGQMVFPVYCELMKRHIRDTYSKTKIEAYTIVHKLLYGDRKEEDGEGTILMKEKGDTDSGLEEKTKTKESLQSWFIARYRMFENYIHLEDGSSSTTCFLPPVDLLIQPLSDSILPDLIQQPKSYDHPSIQRVVQECLKSIHPAFLEEVLRAIQTFYPADEGIDLSLHLESHQEAIRQHLLLSFMYYNDYPPSHVNEKNIVDTCHTFLVRKSQEKTKTQSHEERLHQMSCTILEAAQLPLDHLSIFGGMMVAACPTRCGVIHDEVVAGLIRLQCKEALMCLLTNEIDGHVMYDKKMKTVVWTPPSSSLRAIREIVGAAIFTQVEIMHVSKNHQVGHLYRECNKPNRHGHCNTNPNLNLCYKFTNYGS